MTDNFKIWELQGQKDRPTRNQWSGVAQAFNPRTPEAEARGSQGQPGLHSEPMLHKEILAHKQKQTNKKQNSEVK